MLSGIGLLKNIKVIIYFSSISFFNKIKVFNTEYLIIKESQKEGFVFDKRNLVPVENIKDLYGEYKDGAGK